MGILDPVYQAVNNTIAGAGAVAGSTVNSVGDGISGTGRAIAGSITGTTDGWGNYVKDAGNYVKDSTKAPGTRTGTAANPLGLARSQAASIQYGMNTNTKAYKPTLRPTNAVDTKKITAAPAQKQIAATPAKKPITAATPSTVAGRGAGASRGAAKKVTGGVPSSLGTVTGLPSSAAKTGAGRGASSAGVAKQKAAGLGKK